MDRTAIAWVLVAFFGASIVFNGLRRLTEGEPFAVVAGVQVAALAAIVGAIVVIVRRRR